MLLKWLIQKHPVSLLLLILLLKCRGLHQCFDLYASPLIRWFFYFYSLQLSQFSLKPAVVVSGVIGSIPYGHSPASSGQTNEKKKQWPVTAKLQAIKHWSQWMLALTWFLFLFSMRAHLALHIHSALLYRREQILKPLFKTFCYLLHDCINMAFCLSVFALFSNCTGMTRWCGGVNLTVNGSVSVASVIAPCVSESL